MSAEPLRIGRYELHAPIAAGGMARIYLGRMYVGAGLVRTVAIKRMLPHVTGDPEFNKMFFDEARLAMRVHHPNVVPTIDVVAEGEELLLVMDYVHGESLAGLLRAASHQEEGVPPAVVSAIVIGVLSGLHSAHEARTEDGTPLEIVHRDVSPQNVVVGVDGVARVLDFGVAKAAGRLQVTREDQVKGKLPYMAPEQLTNAVLDRRVDVFAASVVLWEALTGKRLFDADSPGGTVAAVLSKRIPAPSAAGAEVGPEVDTVVLKGLKRHPAERFATAREMAIALERALAPASAHAVGAFVQATCREVIDRRTSEVFTLESRPFSSRDAVKPPARALSMIDEVPSEQHAVIAEHAERMPRPPAPPPRRLAWIAVPLAIALGIGLVVFGVRARTVASPVATTPSSGSTEAAAYSAVAAQSVVAPSVAPPEIPISTGASADLPRTLAPRTRVRPPPRPSHPTGPSKPDCAMPFTVDANGIRVPRPECF